jgi:hypothetical protein
MREEVKRPRDFQGVMEAENDAINIDLPDLELILKLQKSKAAGIKVPLELRYDDIYLKKVFKGFANKLLPIASMRLRDTYEHYSDSFRKYTEEKFYSGIKNLPNLI